MAKYTINPAPDHPVRTAAEQRRHNEQKKRKRQTDYWNKPIVAIDSEGVNNPDGTHMIIMVGISGKRTLKDADGLDSRRILEYLWKNLEPDNLNVIYGGSYDFNMWLKGLDRKTIENVYTKRVAHRTTEWAGFRLSWRQGRMLTIGRGDKNVTINDVLAFYQDKFLQACDENLGDYESRDELEREKSNRSTFTVDRMKSIEHYMQLELRLLIKLVTKLRDDLHRFDLKPTHWTSPGAIAAAMMKQHSVSLYMGETPDAVQDAAQYAYSGGRFEPIKYGISDNPAYEYDLNSAYPYALTQVPRLDKGEWKHYEGYAPVLPFAVYKIHFHTTNTHLPGALFHRAKNGTVCYPRDVTGWYWTPERAILDKYCETIPGSSYEILEAWSWRPADSYKPFGWVAKTYELRAALKRNHDGAQKVLKLGCNSLYGKTCQQVGWQKKTITDKDGRKRVVNKPPKYHQLEWAGYVTSVCRAKVLEATLQNPDAIIAYETDALFSTVKLDLPLSDKLGEWKETAFNNLTYIQSGHYYGDADNETVAKGRGIDKGNVNRKLLERVMLTKTPAERYCTVRLTRFGRIGQALQQNIDIWCKWRTVYKRLLLAPSGKRVHIRCPKCANYPALRRGWHLTRCPIRGGMSQKYKLEWLNEDEKIIREMRNNPAYVMLEL